MAKNRPGIDSPLIRACFAEFMACLLFTFFGPGAVVAGKGQDNVQYSLAFGLGITVLAYGIGDISGGHINPAVTLSMVVTKNLTPGKGLCYFVSQCLGALVGGGILRGAVGSTRYMSGIGLSPDLTQFGGCICEFMGTFLLIFTVFFVAVEHSMRNDAEDGLDMGSNSSTITALAPLPIGFSVLIAHLTLAPLTGCGINPARWVGAVVWQSDYDYGAAWIYWVGPFLASFLAPLTYYALYGTTHSSDAKGAKFTDDSPSATEPALRSIRRVSATGEPVLRLPPVSAEALKVSPL